jgi:hypothetical protein
MDLLDLHLHQPNPLPRLRRLRDREAGASLQTPLSHESRRALPTARDVVVVFIKFKPPQQRQCAFVYALWQQRTAVVDEFA